MFTALKLFYKLEAQRNISIASYNNEYLKYSTCLCAYIYNYLYLILDIS